MDGYLLVFDVPMQVNWDDPRWALVRKLNKEAKATRNQHVAFLSFLGSWWVCNTHIDEYKGYFSNWNELHDPIFRASQSKKEKEEEQSKKQQAPVRPPSVSLTLREALAVLNLPSTPLPTLAEAKRAYRLKVKQTHPDIGGTEKAFIQINNAYQLVLIHLPKATVWR